MPDAATIRLIFSRGIRDQSDEKSTSVRMVDLIDAFGPETANRLAGRPLDLAAAQKAATAARQEKLDELRSKLDELKQLADAGIPDSRRELTELKRHIAKLESGALNVTTLVTVNVAALRQALEEPEPSVSADPDA